MGMSTSVLRAFSVHLLTATGAVFAMLALLAAVEQRWGHMFLWLVVAFAVDGIDGPLARKYDVRTYAPHIDGALLDLIIDYLTYVFIPAYALFQSGILPGVWSWIALFGITFSSGLYFAGNWMKTSDNSFLGFPGCWNMLVLVLFATTPPPGVIIPVITVLAAAMFAPLAGHFLSNGLQGRTSGQDPPLAYAVAAGRGAVDRLRRLGGARSLRSGRDRPGRAGRDFLLSARRRDPATASSPARSLTHPVPQPRRKSRIAMSRRALTSAGEGAAAAGSSSRSIGL